MLDRICFLVIAIFIFAIPSAVMAQSVTPTRVEIDLKQATRATLTLSSTKSVEMAMELSVNSYSTARWGMDIPLEINPPQLLLRPGESRQVTVSWRGDEKLLRSESYYLAIDELPLDVGISDSSAELQLLTSLRLPIHVEATGDPKLGFFPPAVDGSASLELRNTGGRYALLSNYQIGVKKNSALIFFDGLDVARLLNRDAILPGQVVSIPLRLIGVEAAGLQGARLVRKE